MSKNFTWQDALRNAREVLEECGWTQHTAHDAETGQWCLLGALYGQQLDFDREFMAKSEAERVLISRLNGSVSDWNDEPGRTFEEVIALLKEFEE